MSNAGKWRITSNPIDGIKFYRVYRLRDINEVDHSGNREYWGEYTLDREEAAAKAAELNEQEEAK